MPLSSTLNRHWLFSRAAAIWMAGEDRRNLSAFSAAVPTRDASLAVLAGDRQVGGIDNPGQKRDAARSPAHN